MEFVITEATVYRVLISVVYICVVGSLFSNAVAQQLSSTPVKQLTRPYGTITIPVRTGRASLRMIQDGGSLTVDPGDEDEAPEGPASFAVLSDGRFVITDPLAKRLVFYSKQGEYSKEVKLDFSADRVSSLPDHKLQIYDAKNDTLYRFNEANGVIQQRGRSRGLEEAGQKAEAQLVNPNLGVIKRPPTRGAGSSEIRVAFDSPGNRMVSLESLQVDDAGITYVVLDSDRLGSSTSARKTVREYFPDGSFLEISDIESDAFVTPNDEFRIRDGRLYQLVTLKDSVKINYWNLTSGGSR